MDFDKISKKVKKFSQDTVTELQKMNEVRQLNTKVNEEKKHLNHLYQEMGQKFYDMYRDAEQAPEGFEDDFRWIEERYSAMDLFQDQIRAVKGVVLCPCCNMEVSVAERFCSNCGSRMPEVIKIEEKSEEDDAIVVESEVVVQVTAEADSEQAEDAVTEADSEQAEDAVTEADSEQAEDAVTEADSEQAEDAVTEADSEQAEDAVTEADSEQAEKVAENE